MKSKIWKLGVEGKYATYRPNLITDANDNAVATVYGIPDNLTVETVVRDPRFAEPLRKADIISNAPLMLLSLREIFRLAMLPADGSELMDGESDDPMTLLSQIAQIAGEFKDVGK